MAYILNQNDYFPLVNADKYNHITDQDLLARFNADHNNEWLGILLQRYTLLLLGVCMKYLKNEDEAKDSVQQIFLKVDNALVVPEEALVPQGGKQFLIKVIEGPQGKHSQRIEARIGGRVPGKVEVLGGVAEGEMIVTAGQGRLLRGDKLPLRVIDLADAGKPRAPNAPSSGASGAAPAGAAAGSAPANAARGTPAV